MKQHFEKMRIVSLDYPKEYENIISFWKKGNLYISTIYDSHFLMSYLSNKDTIRYLDHFILLLPHDTNKQSLFWSEFYKAFGLDYESLIDKDNNIKVIKGILNYLETITNLGKDSVVLDYGCGTGLAKSVTEKYKLIGYEPVFEMRKQALQRGYTALDYNQFVTLQDNLFDAGFASYVFHMTINEKEVHEIKNKLKKGSLFLANYYKNINSDVVNNMFKKFDFEIIKLDLKTYGLEDVVYGYKK